MDIAQARQQLERMAQWNAAPALSSEEVTDLLLLARRPDDSGHAFYDVWSASNVYVVGDIRIPSTSNGYYYQVTIAGTSGAAEPTWPITGTVTDGTVVWTLRGRYLWTPTYNLKAAAAEGWEWKAGKVASKYDAAVGGGTNFTRSQMFRHCMEMAKRLRSGGLGSVRLEVAHARDS